MTNTSLNWTRKINKKVEFARILTSLRLAQVIRPLRTCWHGPCGDIRVPWKRNLYVHTLQKKMLMKSNIFSTIDKLTVVPIPLHFMQLQLQALMDTLNSTEPHYIRCVKPNNLLKPSIFENINVIQQLRCGVSIFWNSGMSSFLDKVAMDRIS